MPVLASIINVTSSLGYLLPAIIGLESLGLPSPGETALVLAAVLASQGKLQIELVILIGVASAIIGDNIGYLLGRRLGRSFLEAPGPFHKRRLELIRAGDRFFERHGPKAVFFARWIALVRFAAAWLAGINRMRFREFFFWNALGGITWGVTFGLVGYFAGSAAAKVISTFGVYAAVALVVIAALAYGSLKLRERRAADQPNTEQPNTEQPNTEHSTTDHPTTDHPATEPGSPAAASESPSTGDPKGD